MGIVLQKLRHYPTILALAGIIMLVLPARVITSEPATSSRGLRPDPAPGDDWTRAELSSADAARGAEYLSEEERDVVLYLNLARLYPRKFARTYLVPLRSQFRGKRLIRPEGLPIVTDEGVAAVNECIRAMERQKPCKPLVPAFGLSRAATDHVEDCGPAGTVSHTGADGSTMGERMERHGEWLECAGENIAYGDGDPVFIVIQLLVDDGVESRGHRENIFNDAFGCIGVAIGPHDTWRTMCVMDFAGGYTEKGEEM